MEIERAILLIRMKLDEIEELVAKIPSEARGDEFFDNRGRMKWHTRDFMDYHAIPANPRIREGFLRVGKLVSQGLDTEEIKKHRAIRNKKSITEYVENFCLIWKQHYEKGLDNGNETR